MKRPAAAPKKGTKKGGPLTKRNLDKLGATSLEEKVALAKGAVEPDDEAAAAAQLKSSLTKLEHSKLWSAHKTHLKSNPQDAEAYKQMTKGEKGLAAALWCIRSGTIKLAKAS